jgi:NSS family neurotransmitter:Na+ symporter
VGLGNLWRFAWLMGEHGGGPFVLSYLFCLFCVGVPLLSAEILVGTHGRGSPFGSVSWTASVADRTPLWTLIAACTGIGALLLLVLCLFLAGWAILYAFHQQLGSFAAMPSAGVAEFMARQLAEPAALITAQAVAAMVVMGLGIAGIRRGLGVYAWLSVPVLVYLLGVLVRYAIDFGNLEGAGKVLFAWQTLDFDGASFLAALAHALFTLSVGVAVGMTFGAYAPGKVPVVRSVVAVALFDFVIAVAVGVAIYPVLVEANVLPARDFALLFVAVPFAYGAMPFGDFYGALVFVVVALVALGSCAALIEPVVSVLEQQFRQSRRLAVPVVVGSAWLFACIVTLGLARDGATLDLINQATGHALIPLAMLLIALFVGWALPERLLRGELSREPQALFKLWYFLIRFVAAPVIVFAWMWMVLVL